MQNQKDELDLLQTTYSKVKSVNQNENQILDKLCQSMY